MTPLTHHILCNPWLNFGRLLLLLALLAVPACQKKCQAPATAPFNSVTETPWRLVETTDSSGSFQNLNNTNFYIFTFAQDFTGDVKQVENNVQFEVPLLTIKWNPSVEDELMRIEYTATSGGSAMTTIDYSYDLSNELELIAQDTGFYYRFVPFLGIVSPDNNCTF